MGLSEFHTWGCLANDIEKPDRIIFDLDPAPGITIEQLIEAAQVLHTGLHSLGLKSFV